jgi:hypothetical protein
MISIKGASARAAALGTHPVAMLISLYISMAWIALLISWIMLVAYGWLLWVVWVSAAWLCRRGVAAWPGL